MIKYPLERPSSGENVIKCSIGSLPVQKSDKLQSRVFFQLKKHDKVLYGLLLQWRKSDKVPSGENSMGCPIC